MAPTVREVEERPATVEYTDGQVAVTAENSSLNEILRDVARRAGMALKGSVRDERVFGRYGPAAPAVVLAALLAGTSCNMLVVTGSSRAAELILTPKQGGPTPPNPNASAEEAAQEAGSEKAASPDDTVPTVAPATAEEARSSSSMSAAAGPRATATETAATPEAISQAMKRPGTEPEQVEEPPSAGN